VETEELIEITPEQAEVPTASSMHDRPPGKRVKKKGAGSR
jgi:hypothetical protein